MPGSPENLAHVFREVSPKIRRFAISLGANLHEVDEIVSQTFEAYVSHVRRNPNSVGNPEAYLIAITRNEFLRLRRSDMGHAQLEQNEEATATEFEDTLSRELEHTVLGRALSRLNPVDRRLIVLRVVEGLSSEESAKTLGLSVSNTRTRLHRAKHALREEYLTVFAETSKATACRKFSRQLSKFASTLAKVGAGAEAETVPPAKLAKHLSECDYCTAVLAELRDEAATIGRIRAEVWGPIGIGALVPILEQRRAAVAALLAPATALTTVGATLLLLSGMLTVFSPETVGSSDTSGNRSGSEQRDPRASNSDRLLSVTPERFNAQTPAPGNEVTWDVRASNLALNSTLPLFLEIRGSISPGLESPLVSLTARTGGTQTEKIVLDRVPLREAVGTAVRLGEVRPGQSLTLRGSVARDRADADQTLGAELEFVFTTMRTLPEGPGGIASGSDEKQLSVFDSVWLAVTGFDFRLLVLAIGVALFGLGLFGALAGRRVNRLRRAWRPWQIETLPPVE